MFDHGFGWFFGGFWLISLVGFVLTIWALVDCLRVPDDAQYQSGTKVVWVLVIVLLWGIGAVIYLLIGRPKPGATRQVPPTSAPAGSMPPPPPPGSVDRS